MDAEVKECVLYDNEVAFRVRGPGKRGGAHVTITDCAIYNTQVGVRAEDKIERLKTAVSEAAMNAIEHGNKYRADVPVVIQLRASDALLSVRITDEGGSEMISVPDSPNLDAKLQGLQSPRGWGLFLIQNMVDKMNIIREGGHHTVELILYLKGGQNGSEPA